MHFYVDIECGEKFEIEPVLMMNVVLGWHYEIQRGYTSYIGILSQLSLGICYYSRFWLIFYFILEDLHSHLLMVLLLCLDEIVYGVDALSRWNSSCHLYFLDSFLMRCMRRWIRVERYGGRRGDELWWRRRMRWLGIGRTRSFKFYFLDFSYRWCFKFLKEWS